MTLSELADLVERGPGSRELDAQVALAAGWRCETVPPTALAALAATWWFCPNGGGFLPKPPAFTQSLDARLPIETSEGAEWSIAGPNRMGLWLARLRLPLFTYSFHASAPTERLARCAAALRAMKKEG